MKHKYTILNIFQSLEGCSKDLQIEILKECLKMVEDSSEEGCQTKAKPFPEGKIHIY